MTRLILIDASHPISVWLDALYTINRFPTTILRERSPYEVLLAKASDYKF